MRGAAKGAPFTHSSRQGRTLVCLTGGPVPGPPPARLTRAGPPVPSPGIGPGRATGAIRTASRDIGAIASDPDRKAAPMTTATTTAHTQRKPELLGQTVVVIGGSAGIGLETARRARSEGADVILTGRNLERLQRAASELDALSAAAFDATDFQRLGRFFGELSTPIDHVLVTGPGPYYAPLAELDFERARRDVEAHLLLPMQVARNASNKVRPGGTLLFMGGTGGRRAAAGFALISALTAALPALTANLALELAPVRVNLIAAGFVDTPLSASILGDELETRRNQLRATLPIRRVVGPEDVAALAVHIMTNTALTGATYDIDGGQQLVAG
jgi:NAD(P)-dependent dehydrogenase (short-subunit alcohol dehydrogenase family)